MPRAKSGETERWVSDIPVQLAERANALRSHNAKWFTKALILESALLYYCQVAERSGMSHLPPFSLVRQQQGPEGATSESQSTEGHPPKAALKCA